MTRRRDDELRRARTIITITLVSAIATSCRPATRQDLDVAQAVTELGESFNDLRSTQQQQADQIDSLRLIVQRQDSIIRTLANLAGVVMPR